MYGVLAVKARIIMVLTNIYHHPEPVDITPRVPFNALRWGDRYKYSHTGGIHQVFFIGPEWITVRREDDWLVRVTPEMEGYSKLVIKI
ncbi:hypothetical protein D3C86_1714790 [compost metagenome]